MISTGIDLVLIERINDIIIKNPRFITRFFGNGEQELFAGIQNEKSRIQSIAGRFAAKEAFAKALGSGIDGFDLDEVEVLCNQKGAPFIKLSGRALEIAKPLQAEISVSISHTEDYATAVVVILSNPK